MMSCGILGMVLCEVMGVVSCGAKGMVSCRGTGAVTPGEMGTVSCGGIEMLFCGTALDFAGVGRFAFDAFEPIRGVSRGRNDESWALLRHAQR